MNWVTSTWVNPTGLARDPPLAVFGETQAKELAAHFLTLPVEERPTAIFSSPFYRCLQTAKPTAVALGLPLYVEHGIAEWYSPVKPGTGLHPRPSSATALKAHFSEIDESWTSIWYPSRKGESVKGVHKRTAEFLEAFLPELERRHPRKHTNILIFTHGATKITLIRELVGDESLPIRVGCCSLSIMERKRNAKKVVGGWDALVVGDGTYLADGTSREWGFDDIEVANGMVVEDPGVPGTEGEVDEPVGCVLPLTSNL